jgi:hypothetical protein
MRINHLHLLIIIWWIGAAVAALALFVPVYSQYLIVGAAGWVTMCAATGLIICEIKRIKAEDRKKELTEKG